MTRIAMATILIVPQVFGGWTYTNPAPGLYYAPGIMLEQYDAQAERAAAAGIAGPTNNYTYAIFAGVTNDGETIYSNVLLSGRQCFLPQIITGRVGGVETVTTNQPYLTAAIVNAMDNHLYDMTPYYVKQTEASGGTFDSYLHHATGTNWWWVDTNSDETNDTWQIRNYTYPSDMPMWNFSDLVVATGAGTNAVYFLSNHVASVTRYGWQVGSNAVYDLSVTITTAYRRSYAGLLLVPRQTQTIHIAEAHHDGAAWNLAPGAVFAANDPMVLYFGSARPQIEVTTSGTNAYASHSMTLRGTAYDVTNQIAVAVTADVTVASTSPVELAHMWVTVTNWTVSTTPDNSNDTFRLRYVNQEMEFFADPGRGYGSAPGTLYAENIAARQRAVNALLWTKKSFGVECTETNVADWAGEIGLFEGEACSNTVAGTIHAIETNWVHSATNCASWPYAYNIVMDLTGGNVRDTTWQPWPDEGALWKEATVIEATTWDQCDRLRGEAWTNAMAGDFVPPSGTCAEDPELSCFENPGDPGVLYGAFARVVFQSGWDCDFYQPNPCTNDYFGTYRRESQQLSVNDISTNAAASRHAYLWWHNPIDVRNEDTTDEAGNTWLTGAGSLYFNIAEGVAVRVDLTTFVSDDYPYGGASGLETNGFAVTDGELLLKWDGANGFDYIAEELLP